MSKDLGTGLDCAGTGSDSALFDAKEIAPQSVRTRLFYPIRQQPSVLRRHPSNAKRKRDETTYLQTAAGFATQIGLLELTVADQGHRLGQLRVARFSGRISECIDQNA
jgi:hypothetical protein